MVLIIIKSQAEPSKWHLLSVAYPALFALLSSLLLSCCTQCYCEALRAQTRWGALEVLFMMMIIIIIVDFNLHMTMHHQQAVSRHCLTVLQCSTCKDGLSFRRSPARGMKMTLFNFCTLQVVFPQDDHQQELSRHCLPVLHCWWHWSWAGRRQRPDTRWTTAKTPRTVRTSHSPWQMILRFA